MTVYALARSYPSRIEMHTTVIRRDSWMYFVDFGANSLQRTSGLPSLKELGIAIRSC
jgi:hypothetical protein